MSTTKLADSANRTAIQKGAAGPVVAGRLKTPSRPVTCGVCGSPFSKKEIAQKVRRCLTCRQHQRAIPRPPDQTSWWLRPMNRSEFMAEADARHPKSAENKVRPSVPKEWEQAAW